MIGLAFPVRYKVKNNFFPQLQRYFFLSPRVGILHNTAHENRLNYLAMINIRTNSVSNGLLVLKKKTRRVYLRYHCHKKIEQYKRTNEYKITYKYNK